MLEVDIQVTQATEDSLSGDSDDGVIVIIDVDRVFVKDCDVIGASVFSCGMEGMLTDPWVDVELVCRRSNIEWVFCNLGGWDDITTGLMNTPVDKWIGQWNVLKK